MEHEFRTVNTKHATLVVNRVFRGLIFFSLETSHYGIAFSPEIELVIILKIDI